MQDQNAELKRLASRIALAYAGARHQQHHSFEEILQAAYHGLLACIQPPAPAPQPTPQPRRRGRPVKSASRRR